uniref:PX domain-containing protein n=1 Tax=Hyaloperonospora arabidopsidis (strain Emoy2) TaxID=559515 RepID=M4BE48_HYAAE
MTEALSFSRGQQLEAAVEHLPDWYFAALKQQPPPPPSAPIQRATTTTIDDVDDDSINAVHATLKSVSQTDDKPQPLDEDDVGGLPQEPSSNATICCLDDELELNELTLEDDDESDVTSDKELQQQLQIREEELGQSTTSSPQSPIESLTDLVLSGFSMRGREKRVMYHIDVVDHDAPLQTYTIRRSYSDFKELYVQLCDILESRQSYYRNRASSRLARGVTPVSTEGPQIMGRMTQEDKLERSILAFSLPPLPHAGFLTYWKRHDRSHVQSRCDRFQELLRAVQSMAFLRDSFAMRAFLSVAPCAIRDRGSSYVSLCEYGVPTLNPEEEQRERKRRAQEYRRNSTASNQSTRIVEY